MELGDGGAVGFGFGGELGEAGFGGADLQALFLCLGDGFGVGAQAVGDFVGGGDGLGVGFFEGEVGVERFGVGRSVLPGVEDELPAAFASEAGAEEGGFVGEFAAAFEAGEVFAKFGEAGVLVADGVGGGSAFALEFGSGVAVAADGGGGGNGEDSICPSRTVSRIPWKNRPSPSWET